MAYTENTIVILRDFDTVFDLTNTIELWPQLFTEYASAEVLEHDGDTILFRLTTYPEEQRPAFSWVSRRQIDKAHGLATAERLDPTFPFAYMHIRWLYEALPLNVGVVMTWIQEFEPHPNVPRTGPEMEAYINNNTRAQMREIKRKIEHEDIQHSMQKEGER